ncbi:MAG: FIST C-terminal domain-containing protein [Treponema sp.]|nr:FIST C-terminal domain-containing protein [Treponema sp.]
MEQEVVSTRTKNIDSAVNELCGKLRKNLDSYNAVIFLAAIDYDFPLLSQKIKEKFPNAEVLGTSTAGEFSDAGFTEGSIILTTMHDLSTKVKGVFIDHASKYPIAYKDDIEAALKACGINIADPNSHRDAFAIEFTNAIYNAEETILSNFYAIIKNDRFPLAGATAGYTGNTPKSFVSYNGKSTQDGAVMLFVKTRCKFDIRQEDIFNPTGKQIYVTKADTMRRELHTLNGRPATTVYAEQLGVSESQAAQQTFENPFGRFVNGSIHIAALASLTSDKKITSFARITPNSTLEMMHIGDALQKADQTCEGIRSAIPHPKFTLLMTCITRTLYFDRSGMKPAIIGKYKNTFPTFCGFSCYGEQIGRIHCNQTLVSLVIGD